ncbi:ABC transporter ATP-binding protein [Chloroflexota bacterium]
MAIRLVVNDISFSYDGIKALDGVDIEVTKGEIVSLVGPNGAGKSTLLKCIDRILKPQRGTIYLDGKDTAAMNLSDLSKKVGYIPQSTTGVFPYTVFEVVLMGRRPHLSWRVSQKDIDIVSRTLQFLGMEEFGARYFDELSGGEKQKVVMARALAQEPNVMLLDEPTSNLDIRYQLEAMAIIIGLVREKEICVVMAMHDLNLASRFSEKIVMLKDRKVFAAGTPKEILSRENIEEVYGVKARVTSDHDGKPYVIPISPVVDLPPEGRNGGK